MAAAPEIHGAVAPGFEPVYAAFVKNFTDRGERGAQLCVRHRGEVVVDLWAGLADEAGKRAYEADTLSLVFSTTKGLTALAFAMAAERGLFEYDAPVAQYWPEFAQADKARITVRTLLNHRSGLVGIDAPITLDAMQNHPEEVEAILAAQRPHWRPDTAQGYHGVTYGLYAGPLFRRIAGQSLGQFIAHEIAHPLGVDVYMGLPTALEARVATNYPATLSERIFQVVPKLFLHRGLEGRVFRQAVLGKDAGKAFANPKELGPLGLSNYNTHRVRTMELPWCNAIVSARGLATVYSALATGGAERNAAGETVRLLKPESLAPIYARQSWSEQDRVLRKPIGWSQGFVKEERHIFSPTVESFGHPGAGGSLGWGDPVQELGIAYVMNQMGHHVRSPRAMALCRALYESLDVPMPRG